MKHVFACYVKDLSNIFEQQKEPDQLELNNIELWQRITGIIRLQANEEIILFDEKINMLSNLDSKTFVGKKKVFVNILSHEQNQKINPPIILFQGLTKKETFEDIAYSAAALGVSQIQPIISQKISKNWWTEKDSERIMKIMISACEQSKYFVPPTLNPPIKISEITQMLHDQNFKICFDADGESIRKHCKPNSLTQKATIVALFGPEGGLSSDEIKTLTDSGFELLRLTPTILRSKEAATVGLGLLRSLFS